MMHLFYNPLIRGDSFELDEQESKHAIRVLRLAKGDRAILVDGRGGWYEAIITEDHPKRCRLRIETRTADYQPLPYTLHIGVAPTKNLDRFGWFMEKECDTALRSRSGAMTCTSPMSLSPSART